MKSKRTGDETIKCPVCEGTGDLVVSREMSETQRKHQLVRILHNHGFSYREITKYLGYASTNSVSKIIRNHASGK